MQLLSAGLVEYAIDGNIALLSQEVQLPHKDRADRFIVATAVLKASALITADSKLLDWKHRLKRYDAVK